MEVPNKRELQQITLNHSSDIDFKDFMKTIKNVLQNHTFFWLMIQSYYQMILHGSERIV